MFGGGVWRLVFTAWMLGALVWWLRKRMAKSSADRGARIRHGVFVLYLFFPHFDSLIWFARAIAVVILHDTKTLEKTFGIDRLVLSGNSRLALWFMVVTFCAATTVLVVGLARGSVAARQFLTRFLPIVYAFDSLMSYAEWALTVRRLPIDTIGEFVVSQALFAVAFGWIYVWMYRFYRSERSSPLFSRSSREA